MLRAFAGEIVAAPGRIAVRTPSNPTFRWANYLVLAGAPQPGDVARWIALFRTDVGAPPQITHMAFTWDAPEGDEGAVDEFVAVGFERFRVWVMTARELNDPRTLNPACVIRPLTGDADFARLVDLWLAQDAARAPDDREGPGHPEFCRRTAATYRSMCEAGWGEWFGAFIDDRLVASLGVFVRDGLGRFQIVDTHPEFRRQGLAGTLLVHAGRYALAQLGATDLVITADADDVAKDLYLSVGFRTTEWLTELTLVDATAHP
jgi:GNAT superfamily N-acetyltransferase